MTSANTAKIHAKSTSSRHVAWQALQFLEKGEAEADTAFERALQPSALSPEDQGFAYQLMMTALRHRGVIDAMLARLVERMPEPRLLAALRLGLAQVFFLRVPPHAAVDQTVSLVQPKGQRGFLNAVMQRALREQAALKEACDRPEFLLPEWLWKDWAARYGEAEARAMAEAHLEVPKLDVTLKPHADRLPEGEALLPWSRRVSAPGRVAELPGYAEGQWWVQDVAASIPVALLGDVSGKRAIDLCAAPGGKTAQLAAHGAAVTAVDVSDRRLRRLRENLQRLQMEAEIVAADARKWQPAEPADLVVLDAPCSATGTLRRHPELAWRRSRSDIARLVELQRALLANAADMLKPGGELLYITCSLQEEEGEAQLEWIADHLPQLQHAPWSVQDLRQLPQAITVQGALRTLPSYLGGQGGMDGFFAARLRKL